MAGEKCPQGVKNEQRIVALERDMHETKDAISEIRDSLLKRMPNWAAAAITLLTATVTGLLVALCK